MKLILQHDERDCGAACLAMIAGHYGLKLPVSKFRELTKTDSSGTNIYGIVKGAEQINLEASAECGSEEELFDGIRSGEIKFPFIAHTVSDDNMLHYVVIYGCKAGRFLIADPGKGKIKAAKEHFFECWTGYIVTFEKTAEFKTGNYTKGSFIKFFALLKGQYKKLASVLLLSLVVSAIGICGSFVFQLSMDNFAVNTGYYEETAEDETVDEVHSHEDENAIEYFLEYAYENFTDINKIFVCLIGLYILQAVIQLVRSYLILLISKKIDIKLTLSYYNHIMELPVSSISVRQTGEYLSRFSDTSTIRLAISNATITILMDSIMVIACGIILHMQNNKMFIISLIMLVFYAIAVIVFYKPIEINNRNVMEKDAVLQSYFKESIDGVETVKADSAEKQINNKTTNKFNCFLEAVMKNGIISSVQDTLAGTVELVGTVFVLWAGFSMALSGKISVGSVITFYALLAYFIEPIKNLIQLQPMLQTAFVAADRLNDILDLQSENMENGSEMPKSVKCWKFENIDFRYGNRELILNDISLKINRGEKIAIVGESGSGKTTLAKLLLRFYEPEKGKILADGNNINEINLTELRKSIAYVNQNTFLFSDTIKNNLKLGNEYASDEEIETACKMSRASEFIEHMPLGYDTPLDENGMNLSGGQRQRLAIARALLKKPQLLILDEATSNLDTITETGIKNTVFNMDSDLTCIIIAHRLSTIKNCDRIYVIESGSIVEEGTHDELLRLNGKYRKMYDAQ